MLEGGRGDGSGSLFIIGPPATLLMYRTRCSILAKERAAPNLETDKCAALLRPLKLTQLKLGTVQIPLP